MYPLTYTYSQNNIESYYTAMWSEALGEYAKHKTCCNWNPKYSDYEPDAVTVCCDTSY